MGTHTILVASINGASKLNFVTTLSKVLGFVFFIVAGLFVFQTTLFDHFYFPIQGENGTSIGIGGQVHNAAISTLWAFVGIESAVILSGRASSQRDVKRATITGLLIALSIYIIVTLITMGVLPHDKLVGSENRSLMCFMQLSETREASLWHFGNPLFIRNDARLDIAWL